MNHRQGFDLTCSSRTCQILFLTQTSSLTAPTRSWWVWDKRVICFYNVAHFLQLTLCFLIHHLDLGEAFVWTVFLSRFSSGKEEVWPARLEYSLWLQWVWPPYKHQTATGIQSKALTAASQRPYFLHRPFFPIFLFYSCLWMNMMKFPLRP